jgi:hypothetical protein
MKTEILITNMLSAILGSFVFCFTFFYTANGVFYLLTKRSLFNITPVITLVTCLVFMVTYLMFAKWE